MILKISHRKPHRTTQDVGVYLGSRDSVQRGQRKIPRNPVSSSCDSHPRTTAGDIQKLMGENASKNHFTSSVKLQIVLKTGLRQKRLGSLNVFRENEIQDLQLYLRDPALGQERLVSLGEAPPCPIQMMPAIPAGYCKASYLSLYLDS